MALPMAASAFAAEGDDIPVDKNSLVPELALTNGPVFEVEPNAETEIEFSIKNASIFVANNIVISPVLTDVSNNPFKIEYSGPNGLFSSMSGGSERKFKYKVTTDNLAEAKTYEFKLNYLFFNNYGVKYTGSDTFYIKINNVTQPEYSIENFKISPSGSVMPGNTAKISAELVNSGRLNLYDAVITLSELDPAGISVHNGSNSVRIPKVVIGHSESFSFDIIANASMSEGNYPVKMSLKLKDAEKREYEYEKSFYITVGTGAAAQKPALEIQNMSEPPGTYGVNQNFGITFDIVNTGKEKAENIKITASGGDGGMVVPKSNSVIVINSLPPGERMPLEFLFAGTGNAPSQNYPIEFTVTYEDGTKTAEGVKNTVTINQYAGVNVSNPKKDEESESDEEKKQSKPKIIVSKYQADPMIVMAGSEFDLTMTFLNTHPSKAVKNVKMFLTLTEETSSDTEKTGNIFTPVDSSNTFYFDSIGSKQTVDKKLRLYVVPDAQPKTYTLTVNFEYEDAEKNEYTATELLGINVKQTTRLETGEIYVPESIPAYTPVQLSFELYNMGKVNLSNVMVEIIGDVESQSARTFIGNMESGSSQFYDNSFTPMTPGTIPVTLLISYEDTSGEKFERREEYNLNVTEEMPMEDIPMDFQEGGGGLPLWGKIGIGAGIVAAIAAICAAIFAKRRKSRRMNDIFEDDSIEYSNDDEAEGDILSQTLEEEALEGVAEASEKGNDVNEQL